MSVSYFLVTGLYSGRSPLIPGTCATGVIALFYLIPAYFFEFPISSLSSIIVAVLLAPFAIFITKLAYQRNEVSGDDPREIVIDEWAGFAVAIAGHSITPFSIIFAFFAFRFFDILKPPPIKKLENLPGAYGIVVDDLMAGVYANVLLLLVLNLIL